MCRMVSRTARRWFIIRSKLSAVGGRGRLLPAAAAGPVFGVLLAPDAGVLGVVFCVVALLAVVLVAVPPKDMIICIRK